MTTTVHLAISRDVLMTSNMRLHWATRARHTRVIRDMAWVLCMHPKRLHMPAATLEVVTKWGNRRARDAANIEPTAKSAIDGCVDAGLLTDDSQHYLKHVGYSISEDTHNIPGLACYLTLEFTEVTL